MTSLRRGTLIALPWIPLAIALFVLVSDYGVRRTRFALYRPAAAQFFLDRGMVTGSDLAYEHRSTGTVSFGDIGSFGLICPKASSNNWIDYRSFLAGRWTLSASAEGLPISHLSLGQPGDLPFCAAFNGTGRANSGVFRNGEWIVSAPVGALGGDTHFSFGAPGDLPVVVNIPGRGNATDRRNVVYGVYRKGVWYLDTEGGGTVTATHAFGGEAQDIPLLIPRWSSDQPIDGKYSLVIFRDGAWFLKPDPDAARVISFGFGQAGDLPSVVY